MGSKTIYILFGVSGSGKTSVGKELSKQLSIPFFDADDFHPKANIQKMENGFPLDDSDRDPWLQILANQINDWSLNKGAVLACSALKEKYRETLQSLIDEKYLKWIFLNAGYDVIKERLESRNGHFFKKELLTSQFETLEIPRDGIHINADQSINFIIKQIQLKLSKQNSQLGLVGLGVMGKSLAQNLVSKGFDISVYNRQVVNKEVDVAKRFVEGQKSDKIKGFDDTKSFVNSLQSPRTVIIMVNAGKAVDLVIESLLPFLDAGDCLIDGGNSHYKTTSDRGHSLSKLGIHFMGVGISGGEEGARKGPSIMPGGSKEAYGIAGDFLESIAARDKNNNSCCTHVGPEGSGHYIKMIHNGIEYAEMQLLAEIYHLLRFYVKKNPDQISAIFESWRVSNMDSYLLEITADILGKKEGKDYLIDKILDKAGQKGTGGWSTIAALEVGMPLDTISASVMARNLSGMKSLRTKASEVYQIQNSKFIENENVFVDDLKKAFRVASILNHSIGFDLLSKASLEYDWNLNESEIARIWTNGCIIRGDLMEKIAVMYRDQHHESLLLFPEFVSIIENDLEGLQNIVAISIKSGYPLPVLSAAINYILTFTAAQSSANMIQAQRDYFGAHTYNRVDQPLIKYFHTNWKS